MMNMFSQAESLKDFSQDQLINEMKNPSGSAPQFLVLSEIQRRAKARQEMANPQAPSSTVAQDAVNAAGMPQEGLGGMMQAMAPQTDIAQNTAQNPAQNTVQKLAEGGLATINTDSGTSFDEFLRTLAARQTLLAQNPNVRLSSGNEPRYTPPPPQAGPQMFTDMIEGPMAGAPMPTDMAGAEVNVPNRLTQGQRGGGGSDWTSMPDLPELGASTGRQEWEAMNLSGNAPDMIMPADRPTLPARVDQYLSAIPLGPVTDGMTPMDERAANLAQNRATDVIDARMNSDAEATANLGPVDMDAVNTLRPWAVTARDKIRETAAAILSPFGADMPEEPGEEDLSTPRPQARPETAAAPTTPSAAPSGGGGGGGGASVSALTSGLPNDMVTDADKALESDYWLALAKFGAALGAASGGGTSFGQDVGTAGAVGLAAVDQARADYEQRKKDAQELAMTKAKFEMDMRVANARIAASGRSGSGGAGVESMDPMSASWYNALLSKREGIVAQLAGLPPPEKGGWGSPGSDPDAAERMRLNRELQLTNLQLQIGEGSTGLPVAGLQGVNPDIIDTTQ